jgi:hypothetical protein
VGVTTVRTGPPGAVRTTASDWLALVAACTGAGLLALVILIRVPSPDWTAVLALGVGVPAVLYLALGRRYGVSLAFVGVYLGLLDGFLKLKTGFQSVSLGRDVLIAAICAGAVIRALNSSERLTLPPLSRWVIGFCLVVLVQVFNPNTLNATKAIIGARQHLEWVPLFFFAFYLLRSKEALRNVAILMAIIAAVNGAVALLQFQLTPEELAAWGPGFGDKIYGTDAVSGRVFVDSVGNARVRPFGLGSDMGFGGGVGVIAAPLVLALIATGSLPKRTLLGGLLSIGVVVAVLTSQSRSAVLGMVAVIAAFAVFGLAGARVWRSLAALTLVAAVIWMVAPVLVSQAAPGTFDRYASISPSKVFDTAYDYRSDDNASLGEYITQFPLGQGLGMTGAARTFGEGPLPWATHDSSFNAETNFNALAIELGVAGLLLMTAFQVYVLWLVVTRLRRIGDRDVRTYVAGAMAANVQTLFGGLGGPTMLAPPYAPWFWLTAGIAAYWLCGAQGQERAGAVAAADPSAPAPSAPPRRRMPAVPGRGAHGLPGRPRAARGGRISAQASVSVCIAARGDTERLRRTLETVSRWRHSLAEIVVCDDRPPGSPRPLADAVPGIVWIDGPGTDLGSNRNAAVRATTGTHLLFLDDDSALGWDFLAAALGVLATIPDSRRSWTIVAGSETFRAGRDVDEAVPGPGVDLGAMLLPRTLFMYEGFDARLEPRDADRDLALRAVRRGFAIRWCPQEAGLHDGPDLAVDDVAVEASRLYGVRKQVVLSEPHHVIASLRVAMSFARACARALRRNGLAGLATERRALEEARRRWRRATDPGFDGPWR